MNNEQIAVVGMGYVGLPLALTFAEAGVKVLGLDIDGQKVAKLNAGQSYIKHIPGERIRQCIQTGYLQSSTEYAKIKQCAAVIVCVPTPLNKNREPDLAFVLDTGRSVAPNISRGCLVVLESTTYPGTTDGEFRAVLEEGSGLKAGRDFHLAFSPEREDPGNLKSEVKIIPKVVGGLTPACLEKVRNLYGRVLKTIVPVSSCRVAEATKLTENIFRSVNIALVNELKIIYSVMGINIWEVIEAAKTKPFGYMPFYPGPGLGGHCIPIDPFYLTWKAREYGVNTKFIELAGEINTAMPDYVVGRVGEALNDQGKPIKGCRILMLGLAYKADVDDNRESPSYVLIEKLEGRGATVFYNDPFLPEIKPTREHSHYAGRKSVPVSPDYDLILIATAHAEYKCLDFSTYQMPVVDARNCVGKKPKWYYQA